VNPALRPKLDIKHRCHRGLHSQNQRVSRRRLWPSLFRAGSCKRQLNRTLSLFCVIVGFLTLFMCVLFSLGPVSLELRLIAFVACRPTFVHRLHTGLFGTGFTLPFPPLGLPGHQIIRRQQIDRRRSQIFS